jgi:hypothetical protein
MAARHDDDIGVRRKVCARYPRGDVVDDDFDSGREALGVRKLLAVVGDVDPEADPPASRSQMGPTCPRRR